MHFDVCTFCGHFGESGEEGGRRYIRSSLPITSDTVESGLAIIGVNFSERRSSVSKGVEEEGEEEGDEKVEEEGEEEEEEEGEEDMGKEEEREKEVEEEVEEEGEG